MTPLIVLTIVLLSAACSRSTSASEGEYAGVDLAIPLEKPDLVLTDTTGRAYDLRDETDGRLTLVYFGYTNCPDICPIHLAQLSQVLDRPTMPDDVAVVFITVDPERDDPERIRRFLDRYDDDFVGLTGSQAELDGAQLEFDVPLAAREGDGDDYTFGHAGQVFAFAPDGYAYSVYPQGTRQTHWVRDLPLLAAITGPAAGGESAVGATAPGEQSWRETPLVGEDVG